MKWFAAVALVFATQAESQAITGNVILETCELESDIAEAWCLGYALGLANAADRSRVAQILEAIFSETAVPEGKWAFEGCIPDTVIGAQIVDIFIAYLRENPETRHDPGGALFFSAMKEAFPCE